MPHEISDDEFAELQRLRSTAVTSQLDVLKANFRAENPHIPQAVLSSWQGDPDDFKAYGESLKSSFPASFATPASGTPVPTQQQPAAAGPEIPNPAVTASQAAMQPAPVAPNGQAVPAAAGPSVAIPVQAPIQQTPDQQRQEYLQQFAQGQPAQTPDQRLAAPVAVPQPGGASSMTPQQERSARSQQVRDRMASGIAIPAEVQWLAQNGDKGFVAAIQAHGQKIAASVGGR